MGWVVLSYSMSIDGFIAGPDVSVDQPMGKGGDRLHHWMFKSTHSIDRRMAAALSPGAVIVGRRTFDVGLGPWADTPFPAPTFVVTHEKREPLPMKSGTFTFVTEGIDNALGKARSAAEGRNVVVMGADIARQCLAADAVDEIIIHLVPILLGSGTRLFGRCADIITELIPTRMISSPSVAHLSFNLR